jgi:hypothetical protein
VISFERFEKAVQGGNSNTINFNKSSNEGIVANYLTLKTTKSSVKLAPPLGIIASDANMRAYSKYLIDKYHHFRKLGLCTGGKIPRPSRLPPKKD